MSILCWGCLRFFLTSDRVVWREGTDVAGNPDANVIAHGGGAGIFDTIVIDLVAGPLPDGGLNLAINGYASMSSPFTTVQETVDPTALNPGVVEGLFWKDDAMEPKLNAVTPFKVTVPKIIDPTVKQVNVRIGVINYCDIEKNAANEISKLSFILSLSKDLISTSLARPMLNESKKLDCESAIGVTDRTLQKKCKTTKARQCPCKKQLGHGKAIKYKQVVKHE